MSDDTSTALLETLLHPFASGALPWPKAAPIRFIGARDGWPLRQFPLQHLVCEQGFKPLADALTRAGLQARPQLSPEEAAATAPDALVLLLLPRQREHARALLAYALARATPGGRVVACVANNEGAKAAQADLSRLAGTVDAQSRNHCRVFWTGTLDHAHDEALQQSWSLLDAPRPILDGRVLSRPGVFAWDRIDPASALLAEHLSGLSGHVADLGCGWGYLAIEVLRRNPAVTALDLFEADARALQLARTNLAPHEGTTPVTLHWHDVCAGLPRQYDGIVTNPPFHATARDARPDIGRAFIAAAADALRPGGRLWLVANRHLPYEQVLDARFARVTTHAQRDGFKVIEAVMPA